MFPLRDDVPSRTRPLVAWLLLALNAAVFWHELQLGRGVEPFILRWGLVPARYTLVRIAHGWTRPSYLAPFFTAMFLHGGWLHILSNMWVLCVFGRGVEDRLGHLRFLAFYLLCGLIAGVAQAAAVPGSLMPMVGASGAIAGVMGAYLILHPFARVTTAIPIFIFVKFIDVPATVFLGLWLLTQVFATRVPGAGHAGGVAWWAHIGGFIGGVVLLGLFLPAKKSRR